MNRLESKFQELRSSNKKALSVFLTAGFPSPQLTVDLVCELEKVGVDFFEIGFPFSDPIADGPTIQKSSETALRRGMNWERLVQVIKKIRQKSKVPLILMSYSNPIYCRGLEKSLSQLHQIGIDGLILPDLSLEESLLWKRTFRKNQIPLIQLLAPTSPKERMKRIGKESDPFVYSISLTGVTGARKDLPGSEIVRFLRMARLKIKKPIVLGFGISRPEQISQFKKDCDGFIIGSALIRKIEEGGSSPQKVIHRAVEFMRPFLEEIEHD